MKEFRKNTIEQFVEKLPLEKFIPAAFLIFLLCFIVLSLITYNNIDIYKNSLFLIDNTNKVLKKADDINHHLSTLQLKRRGYVVRNESKYLQEYNSSKLSLSGSLNDLKALTSENPQQQLESKKLDSLSNIMVSFLDSSLVLFESEKKASEEQTRLTLLSQDYLDNCELVTSKIKANELELLNSRQDKSRSNLNNTQL
ncbi:MAG: CHASE3 domain-containing protein, partial [Ignavibacteria bacterium]